MCGGRQRVQRPLALRLGIRGGQFPRHFVGRFAGWRELDQGQDGPALELGQPGCAAGAGQHAEAIEPMVVEGMQPVAYRLGVTP